MKSAWGHMAPINAGDISRLDTALAELLDDEMSGTAPDMLSQGRLLIGSNVAPAALQSRSTLRS